MARQRSKGSIVNLQLKLRADVLRYIEGRAASLGVTVSSLIRFLVDNAIALSFDPEVKKKDAVVNCQVQMPSSLMSKLDAAAANCGATKQEYVHKLLEKELRSRRR